MQSWRFLFFGLHLLDKALRRKRKKNMKHIPQMEQRLHQHRQRAIKVGEAACRVFAA
jgi:hypothetical protein